MMTPELPVGVRLPLTTHLTPGALAEISRAAVGLGFSSVWMGDHVILPENIESDNPNHPGGKPFFSPTSHWPDPLSTLAWLSAQLPQRVEIGTSILILPLRNPALLAKQIATASWLTGQAFTLGLGTGWMRDEYDVIGVGFEHRATTAVKLIATLRELLNNGSAEFEVSSRDGDKVTKKFVVLPGPAAPVQFLWGGYSPLALRLIARHCDGWLPTKRSFEQLAADIETIRRESDRADRDFDALRFVVKPGPGPFPEYGAINAASLERYARLGFSQAVLELPLEPESSAEPISVLEAVAKSCS